jgi:hypothetical protein
MNRPYWLSFVLVLVGFPVATSHAQSSSSRGLSARAFVPGTGTLIDYVSDNFETDDWRFVHNLPKSSRENDERVRSPSGYATNGRWHEGPERGQPDHMRVVPTPEGGLPDSEQALLIRTLNSGVPGRNTYDVQQDDLIASCVSRLSGSIGVAEMPSAVARVYLPPAEQWENRTGPHFGFRVSVTTMATEQKSFGFFGSRAETTNEPYWPGMWIHFLSETSRRTKEDSAFLTIRSNTSGQDFKALKIPVEQFGWWTLGMSISADGMIHYYAHAGIEDLTAQDHLASKYPYGYRAQRFRTYFFDVCNKNDGRTWSTPFVIDDPQLYLVNATRVTSLVEQKVQRGQRQAAARQMKKQKASQKTANGKSRKTRSKRR